MPSNITPGHVMAFQAVTTGTFGTPSLWGCSINGEPGAAIVMTDRQEDGRLAVMPLFVTIPPGLNLAMDGEGDEADEGGGGPKQGHKTPDLGSANEIGRHFRQSGHSITGPAPR